jgi:hypothetical protein
LLPPPLSQKSLGEAKALVRLALSHACAKMAQEVAVVNALPPLPPLPPPLPLPSSTLRSFLLSQTH